MKLLIFIIDLLKVIAFIIFTIFCGLLYPIIKLSSEISRKEEEKEGENNE